MPELLIAQREKYITCDFTCTVLDIFLSFGSNVVGSLLGPTGGSRTCVSWPSATVGETSTATGGMFVVGRIWNPVWETLTIATALELIDKVVEAFDRLLEIVDKVEEVLDLNLGIFEELSDAFVLTVDILEELRVCEMSEIVDDFHEAFDLLEVDTLLVNQVTKISWLT